MEVLETIKTRGFFCANAANLWHDISKPGVGFWLYLLSAAIFVFSTAALLKQVPIKIKITLALWTVCLQRNRRWDRFFFSPPVNSSKVFCPLVVWSQRVVQKKLLMVNEALSRRSSNGPSAVQPASALTTYHSGPAERGSPGSCGLPWSPWHRTSTGFHRVWRWWWRYRPPWRLSSSGLEGPLQPWARQETPKRRQKLPLSPSCLLAGAPTFRNLWCLPDLQMRRRRRRRPLTY